MRIYISVDMEGISGVTRWQDVITEGQDYQSARRWMTADVNAAVAGARAAGATSFVVEENHGVEMLCNLLLDEIDPEVDVVRGLPRGGATTIAGLTDPDEHFDAMFLIGHHAKAGDRLGIGAHTISYGDYRRVLCNGEPISEGEMFAIVAGARGVPTVLIAGDDIVCAEMTRVSPGIECAQVKRALSKTGGWIIPPLRAQRIIEAAAGQAVRRVTAADAQPVRSAGPFEFTIELRKPLTSDVMTSIADHHAEFVVANDRTVTFTHTDMAMAYRMAAITSMLTTKGKVRGY